MNQNNTKTQFPAATPHSTLLTRVLGRLVHGASVHVDAQGGGGALCVGGGERKGEKKQPGAKRGARRAPHPLVSRFCSHRSSAHIPLPAPPFTQSNALSARHSVRERQRRARVRVRAFFSLPSRPPHPRALSLPHTPTLTGVSSVATLTPLASVTSSVLGGGPATAEVGGRVSPSSGCVSGVAECARAPTTRAAAAASAEAERRAVPVSMSVERGEGGEREGLLSSANRLAVVCVCSPVFSTRPLSPLLFYTRQPPQSNNHATPTACRLVSAAIPSSCSNGAIWDAPSLHVIWTA